MKYILREDNDDFFKYLSSIYYTELTECYSLLCYNDNLLVGEEMEECE